MHVSHDAEACSSSAGFTPVEGIEVLVPARLQSSTADVEARDPGGVRTTYSCLAVAAGLLALSCTSRPATLDPDEPATGASRAYAFLRTQPGTGEPVRFNPCEPLHYVVNATGAPPGAVEAIARATKEIGRETGITFAYDGTSDERPTLRQDGDRLVSERRYPPPAPGSRWPPVLFFWPEDPERDLPPTALGAGGPSVVALEGKEQYVTGSVVLDPRVRSRSALRLVLLHEIGHLVGLAHVSSPLEMMRRSHDLADRPGLGPGDRQGLKRLGRDAGCLEPLPAEGVEIRPAEPSEGGVGGGSAPGHGH